ncbi:MAG: phosphonate transporter, periplasmic phosphonate-binding protein [Deltaproteobacteria bacterium]|jgi:phosphonate transport system substrate-binding protein|nr:phosphonate transporter, periplasmic phosphonate-binding protein [Deltaproteobacteria bacterium]MBP2682177.1 phosphonate transporter, periplasmic phosphonate-binding protein [Deltaproteobacteria bacterium]
MHLRPFTPFALAACFLLLTGCSPNEPSSPPKTAGRPVLVIGLIPEQNIFKQLERYEPLARYVAGKTGTKIELKLLPRYGNIIDNFQSSGLDGAFFGSFTYSLAHAKLGVEVLARPMSLDNTSTYHGLIFVRKDSGIRNARGMKGKRFAFVDKATTAGYLLPLGYFHDNGIPDYKTYLKETYFAGTHEDVVYDVLNRKADVGAAKNTVYQRLAKADPRIPGELVVLTRSPDVPENGLAFRKDIDPSLRSRVRDALLSMDRDPDGKKVLEQFGAKRFIETTNADYAVVLKYVEDLHLNLANYDYKND